jgi:hypothetical protein
MVGDSAYIVVHSDIRGTDRLGMRVPAWLIAMAEPERRTLLCEGFTVSEWRHGRWETCFTLDSREAEWQLIARAAALVDLHPGRLFAQRALQALRVGTPILVPARSRAREYCESGQGGLWYANAGELLWAVAALRAEEPGTTLGRQGRQYYNRSHGSFDDFAERLRVACGL